MSSCNSICKLPECSKVPTNTRFACPNCLAVPESDFHFSKRSTHVYCCTEHLLADADAHKEHCVQRQTWRTMSRAGALFNMIFILSRLTLSIQNLVGENWESETSCSLWVEDLDADRSWFSENWWPLSSESRMAAVCFEYCVRATQLLRPLLAWLLAGMLVRRIWKESSIDFALDSSIHIQTIDFVPRNEQRVKMASRYKDSWWWLPPADIHTTILLKSPDHSEGLVLDATSMQYLEPVQCHGSVAYYAEKASYFIGDSSNRHYRQPVRLEDAGSLGSEDFVLELATRVINNEVLSQVQHLGGRRALFNLSHSDFWGACVAIDRVLHASFCNLRPRIEHVVQRNFNAGPIAETLKVNDGTGNKEVMEVFEQCRRNGNHA